ncbi:SDR family oxidoreductase [Agaribacterium sp. ZY112]|uniref:SDR family oxidoreductase n=1 Tax=Agaribacterium sp. ZY112 TaxID=3233574 RepID=UPI003523391C
MHILLSGASSGIGRELAVLLAKQGHSLSVCGRNPSKLEHSLTLLKPLSQALFSRAFCLSDFEAISQFCLDAKEQHGPVDVLINCAGLNNGRAAGHQLEHETFDWMMRINCYAPIEFMRALIPDMQTRQSGTVINVLSTTAQFANSGIAGYSASKAALDSYTKVMRKELRKDGIKMLSVYPGGVDSDFREADRPQYLQAIDVAQAIVPMLNCNVNAHIHELTIRPSCEENFS